MQPPNPYPKYTPEHWARWQPTTTIINNPFPAWAIVLHLVMTLGTCLLWLPMWGLHYALHPKTKTMTTYWQ